jgi:hypothetical protein
MKSTKNLFLGLLLALAYVLPAQATSITDYYENKIVDHLFRNTALSESSPASYYVGLLTASCSDSSAGTEVSGGDYARVAVTRGTSAWKGTHGSTTGASSGTNGTISNAGAITFPAPTANWGTMIICQSLTASKTVNNGDAAPAFAIDALTIQIDN